MPWQHTQPNPHRPPHIKADANNIKARIDPREGARTIACLNHPPTAHADDDLASDFDCHSDGGSSWDDYLVKPESPVSSPRGANLACSTHTSAIITTAPTTPSRLNGAHSRKDAALKETASLRLSKLRGCTFVNQYVVIKYLGRGASGRVFLCMDINTNKLFAVKVGRHTAMLQYW